MHSLLTGFQYFMPTRVIFGPGKLQVVGEEVAKFGKRALLVTGKSSARKHGHLDRTVELLRKSGVDVVVFDQIEANPTNKTVNQGGELARREKCDVVIGLGGGSAMDAAKYIAVIAVEQIDCWAIVEGAEVKRSPLPMIAITTTAGTGSEVSQFAVLSVPELKRKDGTGKPYLYPTLSIVDPELTLTLPPFETAASGVDALAQAIEPFTSRFANKISDMFAMEAIRLVAQNLRRAVHNGEDLVARTNMHLANVLAGFSLTLVDTTIAHVIAEAVGAVYNTSHGASVALTLPAVMEFNCVTNLEKFAQIARLLGVNTEGMSLREAAFSVPEALRQLIRDVGLPQGLSALGVTDIDPVVALASRPGLSASNPRSLDEKDIEMLVRASVDPAMSYWATIGN